VSNVIKGICYALNFKVYLLSPVLCMLSGIIHVPGGLELRVLMLTEQQTRACISRICVVIVTEAIHSETGEV
jgi:hypothetical protein